MNILKVPEMIYKEAKEGVTCEVHRDFFYVVPIPQPGFIAALVGTVGYGLHEASQGNIGHIAMLKSLGVGIGAGISLQQFFHQLNKRVLQGTCSESDQFF